jgi:putative hydrolase of the HAD superfamily
LISTLFWDVGGVLLTNGWDTTARRRAAEAFGLDWDDFQERHELVSADLETGRLSLDAYLDCAIFHEERPYTREAFRDFMFGQSSVHAEVLSFVESLRAKGRYLMATLNNESLELNLYRIERFGLRKLFDAFFSSCFLGVKKPKPEIYQTALRITQRMPEECVFIDDRALNSEAARRLGMHAVRFRGLAALREDLARLGVE